MEADVWHTQELNTPVSNASRNNIQKCFILPILTHPHRVASKKPPGATPRQAWSKYRCYLSVLAGFSSHTSGGAPGGRCEYAS